jgi:hypothetical protein
MENKSKKEQLKWMVYVLEESIMEETNGIKKLQLNEELRECKKELEDKYGLIYGIHYMKSY